MNHLGRWLSGGADLRHKGLLTGLGFVTGLALVALVFSFDIQGVYFWVLAVAVFLVRLAIGRFLGDGRLLRRDLASWQDAYREGRLAERLGGNAESLEQAAKDRETILALLERSPIDRSLKKMLARETEFRMEEAFRLVTGLPAERGLSQSAARQQADGAMRWLEDVRLQIEGITVPDASVYEDGLDPLATLRHLAAEREAALAELRG